MRGGMVEKTFTHVEKGVAGEIHVSALVGWRRSAGPMRRGGVRGGNSKPTQCNNFPDLGDFYKNSRKEPTSTIFAKREYR